MIVVDELAIELEHVGSTEPADATTAQVRNLHTGGLDTFEETLVGDNMHIEIGLRQVHIERLTRGRRAELLPVDVALRPAPLARLRHDELDHSRRPAHIEMGAQRLCRQQPIKIDRIAVAVVIDVEPLGGTVAQSGEECRVLRRAHAIVNLIRDRVLVEVFHLRQDRRDTDTTGDQDVLAPYLAQAE